MWLVCRPGALCIRGTGAAQGLNPPLRYKRTHWPKALKHMVILRSSHALRYKRSWPPNPRF